MRVVVVDFKDDLELIKKKERNKNLRREGQIQHGEEKQVVKDNVS